MLTPPDGEGDMLLVAGRRPPLHPPLPQGHPLLSGSGQHPLESAACCITSGACMNPSCPPSTGPCPCPRANSLADGGDPMRGFVRNARNEPARRGQCRTPVAGLCHPCHEKPVALHGALPSRGLFDTDPRDRIGPTTRMPSTAPRSSSTCEHHRRQQPRTIIWDFGFGLRSQLLGYFVRADWGWGVDDGLILPRVFQLSLSTDF